MTHEHNPDQHQAPLIPDMPQWPAAAFAAAEQATNSEEMGVALRQIRATRDQMVAIMRTLALDSVEAGLLTRREAGELLDAHPVTISRWLTARQVQQSD